MGCDRTEKALKIREVFREATDGLDIPHDSWRAHVADGAEKPTPEDVEWAYNGFINHLYPNGAPEEGAAKELGETVRNNPEQFTAKHVWVMSRIAVLREDAERENATAAGRSEYSVTVTSGDGETRQEIVTARTRDEAEKEARRLNPEAETIKSETDSLGRPWAPRRNYSGYTVSNPKDVLAKLKRQGVEPENERLFLEHVTYQFPDKESAPEVEKVEIVGHTSVDGVQAVVVSVNGSTDRPDGSTYHVTMSLAEGRKPFESNKAIQENGYEPLKYPILLKVDPF